MSKQFVFVAALAAAGVGFAETFTWTGAEDAYWTNAANWSVGGAAATRCPGVVGDVMNATDEVWAEWSVNTDRAFFTGVGAKGATTVDFDGLFSISNLVVSGADAPVYTFGTGDQYLPLRSNGDLTVETGVVNMPVLPANVAYGVGEGRTSPQDFTIIKNNGAGELVLSNICFVIQRPDAGSWSYHYLYLRGTGPIRFTGQYSRKSPVTGTSYTTLFDPYISCKGGVTFDNTFGVCRHTYFNTDGVRMTLGDNSVYEMSSDGGCCFEVNANNVHVEIVGTGKLKLNTRGTVRILEKSSVTVDGPQVEPVYYTGCPCLNFTEKGEFYLKGVNSEFAYPPYHTYYGTIKFDTLGMKGTAGALGDLDPVAYLTSEAGLVYAGAGETTDRTIVLSNATAQAIGVLEQAGTGAWKLLAPVQVAAPSAKLVLRGEATAEGEIAAVLADGTFGGETAQLGLAKKGSGTWRLSAANTYTGETSLEGGTLVLGEEGSVASTSDLRFNGGALAVESVAAPRALELPKVTVVSGSSAIETRGLASVIVTSVSRTGGTLDIRPTDGTTVVFADEALKGTSPAWLTLRSAPARIDADGRVVPGTDHVIAAKGDVVPDAPGESVAIGFLGSGADTTLSASATTVGSLAQVIETPATIALSEGDVLTTGQLSVGPGSGDLTVGSAVGVGLVKGADALTLQNESDRGKLEVKSAVAAEGEVRVLAGPGEAVLSGGTDGEQFLRVCNGTLRITGEKTFLFDGAEIGTNTTQAHPPKIVFDGAKDVRLGKKPFKVGYYQGESTMYSKETWISSSTALPPVEMTVTNSTIVSAAPESTVWGNTDTNSLCIGHGCNAILNVEAGTYITNRLMVGCCFNNTAYKNGVVRQHGGEVVTLTGANTLSIPVLVDCLPFPARQVPG